MSVYDGVAVCNVCPHECRLNEGERGFCRARINIGGTVVAENYGRITSIGLDPIEKKPLSDFYPGSLILSVGSYGCNLRCPFCQNHEVADVGPSDVSYRFVDPHELADMAAALREQGNIGVAFTYNEPVVGWEYVRDASGLVRARGMKTVLVTNGCASEEVWEGLLSCTDAMNIDLKAFHESFYRGVCGDLETVKRNIEEAAERCHVELTALIIPGENDTSEEMREMAEWIAGIDPSITLHVTRFFPRHRMRDRKATEVKEVYRLASEARKYIENVVVGNC